MNSSHTIRQVTVALCLLLCCSGCSSLGLSLHPSGTTLSTEAERVLNGSRIPSGMARENAKTVLQPHALQPGDAVLIESMTEQRDLRVPPDQTVFADGTVDLGPFGRVVVAGRSLEQAEAIIEQQILHMLQQQHLNCGTGRSPDVAPDCNDIAINVRLLEPVHRFYVLGEVNTPGAYPLTGNETVLDAIVAAGGLTNSANPCKILLARPTDPGECRVTLPVCYREIVQIGNTATNYQLQPNDRIFVASRSFIDELCFWRAKKPCERCAGCNFPCRDPILHTARPLAMIEAAMIPPGSVAWRRSAGDSPISPPDADSVLLPLPQVRRQPSPVPATPNDSGIDPNPDSDVDGELEF